MLQQVNEHVRLLQYLSVLRGEVLDDLLDVVVGFYCRIELLFRLQFGLASQHVLPNHNHR